MEEGEHIGIIGRNGAGKSSLLRIIAGLEEPDSGSIARRRDTKFEYLNQNPVFADGHTVLQAVLHHSTTGDTTVVKQTDAYWQRETTARILLGKLGMNNTEADVHTLSGGQRKRVALARAMLSDADLLLLDEPTNHLDADTTQWLQDELVALRKGILVVTHDRYFLDAACTRIAELDQQRILLYDGGYEKYLERKESLLQIQEATSAHARNTLRRELAWLAKGARAQRKKQKSRIDWIKQLEPEPPSSSFRDIEIELGHRFLGGKIIDAENVGVKGLFHSFRWRAQPGNRIGIIGRNGAGKSTLLRILSGKQMPDEGWINIGETVNLGYFAQEVEPLPSTATVLSSVREIAEYIDVGVGRERYISARELCNRFGFSAKQQNAYVQTLSGGERRRLALLRVLMSNPNVLFLDEPTNDFDIVTLNALEDYLQYFKGVLLIVSHDRAFLDKTVTTIWSFEANQRIREFPGNYSDYLEKTEIRNGNKSEPRAAQEQDRKPRATGTGTDSSDPAGKRKRTPWDEKKMLELEEKITFLETEKAELEQQLASPLTHYTLAEHLAGQLAALSGQIERLTEQWLALSDSE